jgi:hypothetical protein
MPTLICEFVLAAELVGVGVAFAMAMVTKLTDVP